MDIKDIILIFGGVLIVAVVVHGFWLSWRSRRDPLRIDLVKEFSGTDQDADDIDFLRGELPNGGGRVVAPPHQGALDLDRDEMAAAAESATAPPQPGPEPGATPDTDVDVTAETPEPVRRTPPQARPMAARGRRKTEPRIEGAPAKAVRSAEEAEAPTDQPPPARARRDKVKDVIMPERQAKADEPREPRRWQSRRTAAERPAEQRGSSRSGGVQKPSSEPRKTEDKVDELIVLNVIAPKGQPFTGSGMVEALRARGLRYGRMNIFHRVDPMTRASLYSVANVVEPGTFDMADLENFRSPGVCFFMQLPGPEQPMEAFEDMLKVARDVAMRVGGEVKDEQRSVMTGQTVEHYRQRISDFCRRRMSMRA